MSNVSEEGAIALRSNLQKAATARQLSLMNNGRDFDKRQGGVNSKLPEALHGAGDAIRVIQQEKPIHRTMVNMACAGYQNNEIAQALGRCQQTVATVLKQPWAQEYVINQAKKTVQDEIKAILEAEALPSIRKLVAIRDSVDFNSGVPVLAADKNVAKAAADSLLDRFLGKPVQPMTTDAKPVAQLSDEELRAQVQAELAKGN
jgi:hypothetical protein